MVQRKSEINIEPSDGASGEAYPSNDMVKPSKIESTNTNASNNEEKTVSKLKSREIKQRRSTVPEKPNISFSLWSIMKNCIGKDLSKIPVPVNFSEPTSMLQRLVEDFEYSEILDKAANCKENCEQLAYVAAFTVSAYSTTAIRTGKPFNPLLGTYLMVFNLLFLVGPEKRFWSLVLLIFFDFQEKPMSVIEQMTSILGVSLSRLLIIHQWWHNTVRVHVQIRSLVKIGNVGKNLP